ncbi:MAG TPA: Gfo/Idh/MocA family oxidoreductase [Chloroflexota bacterium]|nr:Gfo/Idh/MocA family oxidoreductase [Chloroflexota bacterium]
MRFGLIGYGGIGQLRAQALRQTAGASLAMIAEPVAGRRAEAARLGVPTTASIEEVVTSPNVDAVVVSTPPNLHREHCAAALLNGKHVLCEKPLAPTVDDCRYLVELATTRNLTLATGFNYRFYPAVVKARQIIGDGRIGEVDHVKSFAGHPGGPEFTHQWVHDPSIVGGGALMDNGIHLADLTLHFLGDVATTYGLASERVWQFPGSEDNGYLLMSTPDGRVGTLHASWTDWSGYHFSVEIHGTEGSVRLSYPPMLTVLHRRPAGSAKRGRREFFFFPAFQVLERVRSYRWTVVRSFVDEQGDFIARVRGRAGVGASGLAGLRAVELAAAAYRGRLSPVTP